MGTENFTASWGCVPAHADKTEKDNSKTTLIDIPPWADLGPDRLGTGRHRTSVESGASAAGTSMVSTNLQVDARQCPHRCPPPEPRNAGLEPRRDVLDDPAVRPAGRPTGTDNTKSANRHVLEDRLKGPRKFWGEHPENPVLALRSAWCTERWELDWAAANTRLAREKTPVSSVHTPKAKT